MGINNDAGKPYDLTSILAISEHNPEFFKKLILVFSDNISNDILLIKEAANAGDWKEAGHLVHKMKPSLIHFGVTSLKDVVINLEHPINNDPQHLFSLLNELDHGIDEVLKALRHEFPDIFHQQ